MARACEPGRALPIARLVVYVVSDTLLLDEATQRHLELARSVDGEARGALLSQIDETKTAPGARLLRRRLLAPLARVADIRRRLDAVELFVTQPGLRAEVREKLAVVADLERLAVKLSVDRATPRDLSALRRSLADLPGLAGALERCPDPSARDALEIPPGAPFLDDVRDLHDLLARSIADDPPPRASDGNVIRDGFDPLLDESRLLARDGQRMIVELEARLRESAGIPSLKLRYTRVFGWYMEVTRSHVDKAPRDWRRKQTIATGERFTCEELDALADKMAHAEDRSAAREAELYARLVRDLAKEHLRMRSVAERLAQWDVASGLAEVAHRADFVPPEVDDALELPIEDGRHPVVERLAAAGRFVPNDVALDAAPLVGERGRARAPSGAARLWLVTGPNMAGKSTFMRQVALIVILAQMGSFVPARRARIGVVDRVLTRVGASDNLAKGESTFMVEMKETANVLRSATRRSLVVLDEIGRGTSTYDGLAIAWAVAEHLHDVVGCRSLFATHYHELTDLSGDPQPGCDNWSVTARESTRGTWCSFTSCSAGRRREATGWPAPGWRVCPSRCSRARGRSSRTSRRGRRSPGGRTRRSAVAPGRAGRSSISSAAPPWNSRPAPSTAPLQLMLRNLDVDRLTPLEALSLLATLKPVARRQARQAAWSAASQARALPAARRAPCRASRRYGRLRARRGRGVQRGGRGRWRCEARSLHRAPMSAAFESSVLMLVIALVTGPLSLRDRIARKATPGPVARDRVARRRRRAQRLLLLQGVPAHERGGRRPHPLPHAALRRARRAAAPVASDRAGARIRAPWRSGSWGSRCSSSHGAPRRIRRTCSGAAYGAASAVFLPPSNVLVAKRLRTRLLGQREQMFFHCFVALPLLAVMVPHHEWDSFDPAGRSASSPSARLARGTLAGLAFVWGLKHVPKRAERPR